jgi:hypothetical protein
MGGERGGPTAIFSGRSEARSTDLLGGAGSSRGRRDPSELRTGDALEFWRVLSIEEPRSLLLLAEMKAPGEALLEFTLSPLDNSRTRLELKARFLPSGVAGMLYWYSLAPTHGLLFKGMLKSIALRSGLSVLQGPVPLDNIPTGCTL